MPASTAAGPAVQLSFANNFWGKEDAGVQPLMERMQGAKTTCEELKAFYTSRASIEDEYARKMMALCRKSLGSAESGTLRASMDVTRGEVESMAKAHQAIAAQMKSELEEPLAAFAGGMKERRKIVQNSVEKLFKLKQQQTQAANKSRDRYEQDCLKIKGYLAQGHMVMGQEERKNKAKMEKTQIQLAATSNEYEAAIRALEETTSRWNRDWKSACDKFQDLEEERLDFTKGSLWTFANIASTVCVSDDASCEKIRLSLEGCEVEKDISTFIQGCGTGQEIPDAPKFINFCRGDVNDNASEASEDGDYSVAQFPRTVNPAFRSSSPQPSAVGKRDVDEYDTTPLATHKQRQTEREPPPMIDYRSQSQTLAPYQHKVDDLPVIPHNEYPADGMTMFCRKGPASERSSVMSPARPSSRDDSRSEYSNPTSLSSVEPSNALQPYVPEDDSKQVQKRRSGFFTNSPFRRKSKHNVSTSPEPTDPRANFQLNVGQNVFDVASPDSSRRGSPTKGLDPIAAALEELKGANKQSSERISADRYAGVSTPSLASTNTATPPPSYQDAPAGRRLGAPQPAFTSAQMQQSTRNFAAQNQSMYGGSRRSAVPRATSPRPMRSTSPRPTYQSDSRSSPRRSPQAHHSPEDVGQRSPRPMSGHDDRPRSSNGNMLALQTMPDPRSVPKSRSKSMAGGANMTARNLPILQYARALYMYRAVIPEELSFAKGDVLAVTRYQDDGWWEAEPANLRGPSGLVPSNYLEHC